MLFKKWLSVAAIILLLLAAGCGGQSSSPPSGFTVINSFEEDGLTSTVYSGTATADEAYKAFAKWLKGNGWSEVDLGEAGEFSEYLGAYTGHWFEKGNEGLVMTILAAGPMTTVTTIAEIMND